MTEGHEYGGRNDNDANECMTEGHNNGDRNDEDAYECINEKHAWRYE